MANHQTIAAAINLLYGAHGRQVHDSILHAYDRALSDQSDYQVERATDYLIRYWQGQHPPSAAEVLARAKVYERTDAAERARIAHNQQQLRIAGPTEAAS